MSTRFSSQVILVAGGTGGLGRAVSLAFLEEEATTVVTYRKQEEFDALKKAADAHAPKLFGHVADVTDATAAQHLVTDITSRHGRLDGLVNCVGGYAGGRTLWETEPKVFEQMLALNLHSGYALIRAAVPAMLSRQRGAIVNVLSKSAIDHAAGTAAYAASKAAAMAMMDALAAETTGTGLRVNSVLPSIIDTEANRRAMPNADFAKWPKPREIAQVILFLCSDQATVIHGAAIPVYGNS